MRAHEVLALARSAGLKLSADGNALNWRGPKGAMTTELRAAMVENKPELLALLKAGREAEVRALYGQAFARLGSLYGDPLVGDLWPTISRDFPALARSIDMTEAAADTAADAYQNGDAPDSSQFLAALAAWEERWAEAIQTATGTTCSDCGRASVVLVATTYGAKFCPSCLRPEPLNSNPKVKGLS